MATTKTIQNPSATVIALIKAGIADKQHRHEQMIRDVSPELVERLKSIQKVPAIIPLQKIK